MNSDVEDCCEDKGRGTFGIVVVQLRVEECSRFMIRKVFFCMYPAKVTSGEIFSQMRVSPAHAKAKAV